MKNEDPSIHRQYDSSLVRPDATRPLQRAGHVALQVINPLSDMMVIYRKGVVPAIDRLRLLREMTTSRPIERVSLTWEQAVEQAGVPIAQLRKGFKLSRALWWILMVLPGAFALMLSVMLSLAGSSLAGGTVLRVAVVILVLTALSSVGFAKTLVANYRLWQLNTQRVSEAERGTFQDFCAETKWCRQVVTLGLVK